MALCSSSSTPRRDLAPRDSPPPPDSPPLTYHYQGGSSNGANKADVGRKTVVEDDNLFVKLEKEEVEIDGKIASIIHDGISKIKAEAVRENISEPKRNWTMVVLPMAVGFIIGSRMLWICLSCSKCQGIQEGQE